MCFMTSMLNYCLVQLLMERPYGMFVVQGLKHPPFDDGGFINFGQYVRTEWMTMNSSTPGQGMLVLWLDVLSCSMLWSINESTKIDLSKV
jgi:hypothetical protein